MRWRIAVPVVLVALLSGEVARAEHAARQEALERYRHGKRLAGRGDCRAAIDEFTLARRHLRDPAILFGRGECYRRVGENELAVADYRQFLELLPAAPNRVDIERRIATLESGSRAVLPGGAGRQGAEAASPPGPVSAGSHAGSGKLMTTSGVRRSGRIVSAEVQSAHERKITGAVDTDPLIADGALDAAVLERELRWRSGAMRTCYQRALKLDRELAGRFLMRWTIGPRGHVANVEVAAYGGSPSSAAASEQTVSPRNLVRKCIEGLVGQWHFPAPDGVGSVMVQVPFVLESSL